MLLWASMVFILFVHAVYYVCQLAIIKDGEFRTVVSATKIKKCQT